MCVGTLYECAACVCLVPHRSEKDMGLWNRNWNGCELPSWCWSLNPDPL